MTCIAIDAMTSECGVESLAHGAWLAYQQYTDIKYIVVGDKHITEPIFKRLFRGSPACISFRHTDDIIEQSDEPLLALQTVMQMAQ